MGALVAAAACRFCSSASYKTKANVIHEEVRMAILRLMLAVELKRPEQDQILDYNDREHLEHLPHRLQQSL